jgi:hypothetical protein
MMMGQVAYNVDPIPKGLSDHPPQKNTSSGSMSGSNRIEKLINDKSKLLTEIIPLQGVNHWSQLLGMPFITGTLPSRWHAIPSQPN